MKILLDQNVPRQLRRYLPGHLVQTAYEMGWAELENGGLLHAAEQSGFDVLVSGDKNLKYQQNMGDRKIALVALSNNDWNVLKVQPDLVVDAVARITVGSYEMVVYPKTPRSRPEL